MPAEKAAQAARTPMDADLDEIRKRTELYEARASEAEAQLRLLKARRELSELHAQQAAEKQK